MLQAWPGFEQIGEGGKRREEEGRGRRRRRKEEEAEEEEGDGGELSDQRSVAGVAGV